MVIGPPTSLCTVCDRLFDGVVSFCKGLITPRGVIKGAGLS